MRVDAFASQSHYVGHLVDTWRALPDDMRGTWWATERTRATLRAEGIEARSGRPSAKQPGLVLVAGAGDMDATRGHRHVFVEHGAGQSYGSMPNDPSYSGGSGRESVALFLCPNDHVAERNRARYPVARVEVVGSPWVDQLRSVADKGHGSREGDGTQNPPVVALSFHWRCTLTPEAGWALPHYEASLSDTVRHLVALNITVIGHGHPRYRGHFARLWQRLGIEHVPDFADVVRRASVYVVDNSSTAWEAAACDIPVVLLDAPWFNCGHGHWPRFDGAAASHVGEHCQEPADVVSAIARALDGWTDVARRKAVAAVYPLLDGGAAERSAIAIAEVAAGMAAP